MTKPIGVTPGHSPDADDACMAFARTDGLVKT
jgi:hypothetical protein